MQIRMLHRVSTCRIRQWQDREGTMVWGRAPQAGQAPRT